MLSVSYELKWYEIIFILALISAGIYVYHHGPAENKDRECLMWGSKDAASKGKVLGDDEK